jgi:hypothetical protein
MVRAFTLLLLLLLMRFISQPTGDVRHSFNIPTDICAHLSLWMLAKQTMKIKSMHTQLLPIN